MVTSTAHSAVDPSGSQSRRPRTTGKEPSWMQCSWIRKQCLTKVKSTFAEDEGVRIGHYILRISLHPNVQKWPKRIWETPFNLKKKTGRLVANQEVHNMPHGSVVKLVQSIIKIGQRVTVTGLTSSRIRQLSVPNTNYLITRPADKDHLRRHAVTNGEKQCFLSPSEVTLG